MQINLTRRTNFYVLKEAFKMLVTNFKQAKSFSTESSTQINNLLIIT